MTRLLLLALLLPAAAPQDAFELRKNDRVGIIGNTLADRMQHTGWMETLLNSRFPEHDLVFRNLGYSADELDSRPRSENFGTPDQHLSHVKADVVFAFFGYNEAFSGESGLSKFRKSLAGFIDHTLAQKYNGRSAPRLVLFSPVAHENLKSPHLPDGSASNARLAAYTRAMEETAREKGVAFVNLFAPTQAEYARAAQPLTINGVHLNDAGDRFVADVIDRSLFGPRPAPANLEKLRSAVVDRNFHWWNRYRMIDEYNVFGGRSKLAWHGQSNADVMKREMEIFDVMTQNRDRAVWSLAKGGDGKVDDSNLPAAVPVKTNKPGTLPDGGYTFLGGEEAIAKMKVAQGLEVNLFASEEKFPDLANPVQMAVDTDSRLWVSAWPSYPHWNPLEPMRDKLLILTDEDRDGKADKATVFADNLNSVTGFEFWGGGVIVAAAPELLFLKDTDGDDKADVRLRILHGVSSADSHHTANSMVLGPDGGIYFSRGVFHFDNMETPTKTFRSTSSGVYRFDPRTYEIGFHFPVGPNPHGDCFDAFGNQFASDGTGGSGYYVSIGKGVGAPGAWYKQRVRPVPAIGFLNSSHFPPENDGNFLICNVIGFLGILQHKVSIQGADYRAEEIEPIVVSSDPNFRPSDVEVGGDGALYFSDWHNPIIGHMQHNMRDPNRDHTHGRIYRVTAKGRPLVEPAKMKGKPVEAVLEHFRAKEAGTRYRARIELSGRDSAEVAAKTGAWAEKLTAADGQLLLEALWVFEEHRIVNEVLLARTAKVAEPRIRAAAIRTLRDWGPKVKDWSPLLLAAARDESPLVRAEAAKAATSFTGPDAAEAIFEVISRPVDPQLTFVLDWARKTLNLDAIVQQSLKDGRPLSAAGMAFALRNLSVATLAKMERTEAVCLALLQRSGVPPADRRSALESLAKLRNSAPAAELLTLLEAAVESDLARLLPELPAADLKPHAERLHRLAGASREEGLTAALISADASTERASKLAAAGLAQTQTFLRALLLIKDVSLLHAAYPAVKRLTTEIPAGTQAARPSKSGRYVRVELPGKGTLTLAEVEVWSLGANVARGRKAKQSSTSNGGDAARAVDGKTNGEFGAGTSTHTQENQKNPWWEVDLGAVVPVEKITLWNRTDDALGARLNGAKISLLDAARAEVWSATEAQAPKVSKTLELGGDPAEGVQSAAIAALVAIPGHEEESFLHLAGLIREGKRLTAAVPALLKIDAAAWSKEQAPALASALQRFVPAIPLNERSGPYYRDCRSLADRTAKLLPEAAGKALTASLTDLDLQLIRIATLPEQMRYDKVSFAVVAGKPVRITLENKDMMPHNLLVVEPGGASVVGPLAEKMGPEGFSKQFKPDSPLILFAMTMVNPMETAQLDFIAPAKPGDYEYVCTFPGHWMLMRGVMKVVKTAAELPANAGGAGLDAAKEWKIQDLATGLASLRGRSHEKGRELFTKLGCAQCHKIRGEGGSVGPDLNESFMRWKRNREELLTQILEPSKIVEEKYRPIHLKTVRDEHVFGLVLERTKEFVSVVTNPQNPVPQKILIKDIAMEKAGTLSLMPAGLLNTLDKDQILDLAAYLEAAGDPASPLFQK